MIFTELLQEAVDEIHSVEALCAGHCGFSYHNRHYYMANDEYDSGQNRE
jgi:hypothetical protein